MILKPDNFFNDNLSISSRDHNYFDLETGFLGTMKPDQMQAFNPLFIIILIPLFETVIYPLLRRPKPLKRICAGMFLATVAFIFAGFLQMKIQVIVIL